jgi:hypothetical protein
MTTRVYDTLESEKIIQQLLYRKKKQLYAVRMLRLYDRCSKGAAQTTIHSNQLGKLCTYQAGDSGGVWRLGGLSRRSQTSQI